MGGALAGIRVLDFTQAWAGPACTQRLADQGADVIKVESARRPDVSRAMGPYPGERDGDASGYYLEWNRNKRSIDLDLRDAGDVAVALALAERADVVVENFSPGVMERLGLGYDVMRGRRPDVVMLSISGFGATGPDREAVAFGQQVEAESGLMTVTGYEGGEPLKPGISYPDPVAAVAGVAAVMTALLHRDRTGEGQWIDLSMLEITASLLVEPLMAYATSGRVPGARGNASPYWAPCGIYPCLGTDRWVAIECRTDDDWSALARVGAGAGWASDPRFATRTGRLAARRELDDDLAAWTAVYDRGALVAMLRVGGVPAAAVADIADLMGDEHLTARAWWSEVRHPLAGSLRLHGPLSQLEGTPATVRMPPPRLGEHSQAIRAELADA